ncbi:MAG: chemotaxis protein CheW [Deltaproteobacteria bacterium]|nr:chemotaxis protein CheW [Deltaproteobacteria bacterium]
MNERIPQEKIEEILKDRAEKVAAVTTNDAVHNFIATVAVVGIGRERFGIPLNGLAVIAKIPPIAHLPKMPPAIRGIVQIRGELISVIDIAKWFNIGASVAGRLLAVVEGPSGKLGLLVDSVLGFQDIMAEDMVETLCDDAQSSGHPIQATTKDLIAILDLEQLFRSPDIAVDYTAAREMQDMNAPQRGIQQSKKKENSK